MYLHKETLGCDQTIEYFSKVTVLCHTGVHIITSYLSFNVASWLVLLYIMLQAFWFTAVPTPAVSFSIIGMDITKQTKLKSQWVYFICLQCSYLTAVWRPLSGCQIQLCLDLPQATKSSTDHKSNLISLPEGSDPSWKSDCMLKDKPMSYFVCSNKHSG